jgi:hypothetical protein
MWQWVLNGVLTLICVDIGPTGPWGKPTPAANSSVFPDYSNIIATLGVPQFDVVLVRGSGLGTLLTRVWA